MTQNDSTDPTYNKKMSKADFSLAHFRHPLYRFQDTLIPVCVVVFPGTFLVFNEIPLESRNF